MSRVAVILFLSIAPVLASAASCGPRVLAYNTYDQIEKGHMIEKHSVFKISDWSNDSSYEGFVVAKSDEAATLRVEARKALTAALIPWTLDPNYRVAEKLDMGELAKQKNKTYKVQLLKNGKVLCEDAYAILDSGESEDGP